MSFLRMVRLILARQYPLRPLPGTYAELPERVRNAIYEEAKTPCPDCGMRGVPQSWAVVAYREAIKGER